MKFKSSKLIIITGIVLFFLYGCAAYTIQLVDEEKKPVPDIPIKILDENGKDQIRLDVDESNSDGEFTFPLKEIPGDSFLVEILVEEYLETNQWISKPIKNTTKEFTLEKRVTIITGIVLDINGDEIPKCEVTTNPPTKTFYTDHSGRFIIKFDKFSGGVAYTIFVSKNLYIDESTIVTPDIDEVNDLNQIITLIKVDDTIIDIDIKGSKERRVLEDRGRHTN